LNTKYDYETIGFVSVCSENIKDAKDKVAANDAPPWCAASSRSIFHVANWGRHSLAAPAFRVAGAANCRDAAIVVSVGNYQITIGGRIGPHRRKMNTPSSGFR
jgi:hypothetical protein